MILRRIRGVVVSAVLWGVASCLAAGLFTSIFYFADANRGHGRGLLSDLADMLPETFGMGAGAGLLFAMFIVFAERHQTLQTVSERRFRVWGMVAGALSIAVLFAIITRGQPIGSMTGVMYSIVAGGFSGATLAPAMLRAARRGGASAGAAESDVRRPVV